ncbi:MAG: twin-arginine translocase subunit TatC [Myxococcales bacterium]|nr:twin-arginine translocase subunit TatC [Myxococcales bacterium]
MTQVTSEPEAAEDPAETETDDKRMSLFEHLSELRMRMRNAAIAFVGALVLGFVFNQRLYEVLTRPVRAAMRRADADVRFVITAPGEAFWVYFKLSIFVGLIIAAPLIFWELWKFVAPGLYKKEQRLALLVVGSTAFCFVGGAVFGYYVLVEPAIYFLVSITNSVPVGPGTDPITIETMFRMEDVAGFTTMMLLGCGIAFELPVVVSILGALDIVTAKALWKFNKYSLVLSALLGGILTPGGDVVSQMLLAGPVFALYNLSILVVMVIERGRRKKEAALDAEYGPEPFER